MSKVAPVFNAPTKAPAKKEKAVARKALPPTVMHPLLNPGPDGKATTKLKEWPADFKTTMHKPLAAKDFEDPAVFYNGKADRLQKVVDKLREEAKNAVSLAGIKDSDKANAKKFLKLKSQLETIQAELSSGGVDVEAMLKLLASKKAAATEAAPTEGQSA